MKKLFLLLMLLPGIALAQPVPPTAVAYLAANWDMDGEAADDDQIVTSADLVDNKLDYTIAAQPDVCRLVDITITDANSSIEAGLVRVRGTDCLGYPRLCLFDFAVVATRGSGVKALSPTQYSPVGSSCYLSAVSAVETTPLTGEGGAGVDLIKVGYTSNSVYGYPMYGVLKAPGGNNEHGVDPFGSVTVSSPITTAAEGSTTVTAVGDNGAFTNVAVNDLLLINVDGVMYPRRVTARANENSITVDKAIWIRPGGVGFQYKKFFFTTDPMDDMWIPVKNKTLWAEWNVKANANTGGTLILAQCATKMAGWPVSDIVHTVGTSTVASASTGTGYYTVDTEMGPVQVCRVGVKFGTGDDADVAAEDISINVMLR